MPNERYSLKATLLAPCHPPDGIQRRWAHTANPLGQNFVSIIASSKMHRYKLGKSLGEGAFGSVRQAALEDTREQVSVISSFAFICMMAEFSDFFRCITLTSSLPYPLFKTDFVRLQ